MVRLQRYTEKNQDFKCLHCHYYVSADAFIAGVNNRNHCPYCLWSRHMDLFEAGDRLAVCKAEMQPIGLTLKRTRKKYGMAKYGELMLIHLCSDCEKISLNRIAADDDTELVYEIYKNSLHLDIRIKTALTKNGIHALGDKDNLIVETQLFGRLFRNNEFA